MFVVNTGTRGSPTKHGGSSDTVIQYCVGREDEFGAHERVAEKFVCASVREEQLLSNFFLLLFDVLLGAMCQCARNFRFYIQEL